MGGPSTASGVALERLKLNRFAMVGRRTHPLKAILKRRRKGIKTILRNQQFSVNENENEIVGLFNVGLVTPGTYRRQERFFNE